MTRASGDFPATLKIITIWLLIGVVLLLGFMALQRQDKMLRIEEIEGGQALLLRRARDGHYHLPATINGRTVEFLVDTGASVTSISRQLADDLVLKKISSARFVTANGEVQADIVTADLRIADTLEFKNLRIAVLPGMRGSALLGMDVLGRFALAQDAGTLRLTPVTKR